MWPLVGDDGAAAGRVRAVRGTRRERTEGEGDWSVMSGGTPARHIGFLRIVLRRGILGKTSSVILRWSSRIIAAVAAALGARLIPAVAKGLAGSCALVQMRDTVKALGFGPKGLVNSEVRMRRRVRPGAFIDSCVDRATDRLCTKTTRRSVGWCTRFATWSVSSPSGLLRMHRSSKWRSAGYTAAPRAGAPRRWGSKSTCMPTRSWLESRRYVLPLV